MNSTGGGSWIGRQLGRARRQWPIVLVLLCLLVSCAVLATGHWRRGAFAFACTVALAGVLRTLLPSRMVGLLKVRSRWADALLLVTAAAALLVLVLVVPASTPPSQR